MKKPPGCFGCPLYETGKGFCPDKAVESPALILLGEAPGKTEINKGEPFVGQAGFVLKEWAFRTLPELQVLAEQGRLYFGNTLRCLPPSARGRNYPTGEVRKLAEEHCRRYDLWNATTTSTGQDDLPKVALLGETPQRYWFSEELKEEDRKDKKAGRELKGVMGRIGRRYQKEGRVWIFAPHPAWVLRQPQLIEHLEIALKIALSEVNQ